MSSHQTVKDYFEIVVEPQETFLKKYPYPFLVIVDRLESEDGDDEEDGGSFFFTKAFISRENQNVTIGGGPVLDPGAVVLPVQKAESAPSESALASTVMIGRNEDNDLVLNYSGVSKYHCYIAPQPFAVDEYTISDNGSTNGTFVNMQKVKSSSRSPLKSGDMITLGHALGLRFYLAEDFWETLQENRADKKIDEDSYRISPEERPGPPTNAVWRFSFQRFSDRFGQRLQCERFGEPCHAFCLCFGAGFFRGIAAGDDGFLIRTMTSELFDCLDTV